MGGGLSGQGAQQVVGLHAGDLHDGNAESLDNLADAVHLDPHLIGHAVPMGLVVGVNLVPPGVARVKADGDVVGLQFLEDVEEGGGEAVGGVGGLAVARGEAFQRQGVEGPVGQGVTVYENQAHGTGRREQVASRRAQVASRRAQGAKRKTRLRREGLFS